MDAAAQQSIGFVERYGSFAVLVILIAVAIYGGFRASTWFSKTALPMVLKFLEERDATHVAQLAERDLICKQNAESTAANAAAIEKNNAIQQQMAATLTILTAEVSKLKERPEASPPTK